MQKKNPERKPVFYKFSVSMPGAMYAAVKREANRRVSNVSQIIRDALREFFENVKREREREQEQQQP